MTKGKLVSLAVALVGVVVAAAVQSGVLPNICPPPPVCASPVSEMLDAGAE